MAKLMLIFRNPLKPKLRVVSYEEYKELAGALQISLLQRGPLEDLEEPKRAHVGSL